MLVAVLRVTRRASLWLGVALLAYSACAVAYSKVVQVLNSRTFEERIADSSAVPAEDVKRHVELRRGDLIGRLEVSRIGLTVMVAHGVDESTLASGAGHVPGTPLPGADGNVSIAAHRDTFFRKLKSIRVGDRVRITTVRDNYDYVVESTETVDSGDTRVMESRARSELTLITCYPFYFIGAAPQRFVVHALPAGS